MRSVEAAVGEEAEVERLAAIADRLDVGEAADALLNLGAQLGVEAGNDVGRVGLLVARSKPVESP